MEITSYHFKRLIMWLAYNRYNIILNKTQVQKLMFMCYGLSLARYNQKLFTDDTPKAWPFGPVFPKTYKGYSTDDIQELPKDFKTAFVSSGQNIKGLKLACNIVDLYHSKGAKALTDWSHGYNTPWSIALRKNTESNGFSWNVPIDDEIIKKYFEGEWQIGL